MRILSSLTVVLILRQATAGSVRKSPSFSTPMYSNSYLPATMQVIFHAVEQLKLLQAEEMSTSKSTTTTMTTTTRPMKHRPQSMMSTSIFTATASSVTTKVQDQTTTEWMEPSSTTERLEPSSTTERLELSSTTERLGSSSTTERLEPSSTTERLEASSTTKRLKPSSTIKRLKPSSTTERLEPSSTTERLEPSSTTERLEASSTTERLEPSSTSARGSSYDDQTETAEHAEISSTLSGVSADDHEEMPEVNAETTERNYATPEVNHESSEAAQETPESNQELAENSEEEVSLTGWSTEVDKSSSFDQKREQPSVDSVVDGIYEIIRTTTPSFYSDENLQDSADDNEPKSAKWISSPETETEYEEETRFTLLGEKVTQVPRPSLNNYLKRAKVPLRPALQQLANLYDALSKDARKQGYARFAGYTDEVLKDLQSSAEGGIGPQLKKLLEKMVERNELTRDDAKMRTLQALRDLDDPASALSKDLRRLLPLRYAA